MKGFGPALRIPSDLRVVERLRGDATTDFGAPSQTPKADRRPVDVKELARLKKVLHAAWAAFDEAAEQARGRKLKTGPRGGGRSLAKIVGHVVGAEGGYVRTIRGKAPEVDERQARAMANVVRGMALEALARYGHRGPARERAAQREDLDAAVLRATGGVARARPRVGDSGHRS